MKGAPEDRHGEPLVGSKDEVAESLDERPLPVDRCVAPVVGETPGPLDRAAPCREEGLPPLAHVLGTRRVKLRTEGEPIVALVDVAGHIHPVDDESINLGIDDDIAQSGVRDPRPHHVDIPERRTLQVHAPEHGVAQVLKFELLGHPSIMAARADRRRSICPRSPAGGHGQELKIRRVQSFRCCGPGPATGRTMRSCRRRCSRRRRPGTPRRSRSARSHRPLQPAAGALDRGKAARTDLVRRITSSRALKGLAVEADRKGRPDRSTAQTRKPHHAQVLVELGAAAFGCDRRRGNHRCWCPAWARGVDGRGRVSSAGASWIALYSTPGDNIGGGGHQLLQQSASLTIDAFGTPTGISLQVRGSAWFNVFFAPAQGQTLAVGNYADAITTADVSHPKMDISGSVTRCNSVAGQFNVEDIAFANGEVSRLDITFVQHCDGGLPALIGQISYNEPLMGPLLIQASSLDLPSQYVGVANIAIPLSVTNTTVLPVVIGAVTVVGWGASDVAIGANDCPALLGPGQTCVITATITPRAAGIRQAEIVIAGDLLPATVAIRDTGVPGNAAFTLDSAPGDPVGASQQLAFNQFNATIAGQGGSQEVDVSANADGHSLYAAVAAPAGQQLAVGDYADAVGLNGRGPGQPGVLVTTNLGPGSQSCAAITGRFSIRDVAFDRDGRVVRLAADVEQHCGTGPGLFVSLRLASSVGYSALAVAPSTDSLTFPSLLPGSPSPPQRVLVSNVGVLTASIAPPVVGGPGPDGPDFQVSASTCGSLVPGASCTMSVTFTPHGFGARAATLGLAVGTARGQLAVSLSGDGASPPAFTYPVAGQTNADTTKPFAWGTSPQADGYYVVAGTKPGAADLVNSGILPPSQSSYDMPAMAQTVPIYATLFTRARGHWDFYQTISFTTFATAARFTYPLADMVNVDPTRLVTWSANRQALGYHLRIGTQPGGSDLLDSGPLPASQSSYKPPPLPANTALYAMIDTSWVGFWQPNAQIVRFVIQSGQATFTSPLNGRRVVDATARYTWTTVPQAQAYVLVVSTTPGGANLINSGVLPATQWSFPGVVLPKGVKLYATVFTKLAGSWSNYQTITFSAG